MPSLVDYDDGDGIDEEKKQEEEQMEEEDDFIGIIFPSIIFSYLFLFLKPSFHPLTPNLRVTVDFLFPLRFPKLNQLTHSIDLTFLCLSYFLPHFITAFTLSLLLT